MRGPRPADVGTNRARLVWARVALISVLVIVAGKLVQIQTFDHRRLAAAAERQQVLRTIEHADRGSILDDKGRTLAFSSDARVLYAVPKLIGDQVRQADSIKNKDVDAYKREIAAYLKSELGDAVDEQEVLRKLLGNGTYVTLTGQIEPGKAEKIRARYPVIGSEYKAVRYYPGESVAANIIGYAHWRHDNNRVAGLVGLESSRDELLAGSNGERVAGSARGSDMFIPGTDRVVEPAVNGSDLHLTIDADMQYAVQNMVADYAARAGARSASVVVLDASTAQVRAMANNVTFDPTRFGESSPESRANPAVSTPFEPGSVNKVVTAAAGIEYGLVKPETVLSVPGNIKIADRVIRDAWNHGRIDMTFTGVLAQSSNVGTLMIAQKIGEERFSEFLGRFGLGVKTEVGLPGESAGVVPPRSKWSGSTFANLPIGQGLSMTVLQMAGMYQAIANDGVRIPPRVIKATVDPEGVVTPEPAPPGVRVVSPQTAKTVRDMLRSVVQSAPGQVGTGPQAAVEGYQISGKTGTAQQIDKECGCYSDSKYWITFAGVFPADKPRYVIAIVLDAPSGGSRESRSAAPLFHDIASYLGQRFHVPLSQEDSPVQALTIP